MDYKPYSLYQYGQVDGRTTFQHRPFSRCNRLMTNITQMDILWNETRDVECCFLVFMSFEPNCRISFDARYMVPPFDDIIAEGKPFIVGIQNGLVEIEPLDPNRFFCKY